MYRYVVNIIYNINYYTIMYIYIIIILIFERTKTIFTYPQDLIMHIIAHIISVADKRSIANDFRVDYVDFIFSKFNQNAHLW